MSCPPLFRKLDKLLEERKTLKEIGAILCEERKHPEAKAIRLIIMHKGRHWLMENKDWLKYQPPRNPTGKNGKNKPEKSGSNVKEDGSKAEVEFTEEVVERHEPKNNDIELNMYADWSTIEYYIYDDKRYAKLLNELEDNPDFFKSYQNLKCNRPEAIDAIRLNEYMLKRGVNPIKRKSGV